MGRCIVGTFRSGSARRRQLRQGCGPSPRVVTVASTAHAPRSSACHGAIAGPVGPAGQAEPDPYTRRLHRPTVASRGSTADPPPTPCRGEALPRPPRRGRGRLPWRVSTTCTMSPVPGRPPHHGIPGLVGPAGQAEPDPYRTGLHRPTMASRGSTADPPPTPCRGEALPRPPRRGRGDSAWPTRLARHAAPISRAAVSTIARP